MKKSENYLDKIPVLSKKITLKKDSDGRIMIVVEHKNIYDIIFQKLLKKPRFSHLHLEEYGSFILPLIDGKTSVFYIGEQVKEHFGDKAEPLYDRLCQYMTMLKSRQLIDFKK